MTHEKVTWLNTCILLLFNWGLNSPVPVNLLTPMYGISSWKPIHQVRASLRALLYIFVTRDLLEASFFQLSLSPTVVINCVTLSGPSGLNDGGDQEEDASHEGGEGQPDGPLWQLWAGQLGLFFHFVEFSIQHRYLAKKTWSGVLQHDNVRERRS